MESGSIINTDTLQQELEQKRELNRQDDTRGEINPYEELIVNKAEKIELILTQMEQWPVLSNTLNYIQYDRHPKNYHSLNISSVNKYRKSQCIKEKGKDMLELDFGQMLGILKEEYLGVCEKVYSQKY